MAPRAQASNRASRITGNLLGLGLLLAAGCGVEPVGTGTGPLERADDPASPEFPELPSDAGLSDAAYPALECPRGGNTGPIRVVFECDRIVVITCKDLSNVVIETSDGSRVRHEGLSGQQNAFPGSDIVGVWVKAGANHSGDGPGYGERFDAPEVPCEAPPANTVDAGPGPAPDGGVIVSPD